MLLVAEKLTGLLRSPSVRHALICTALAVFAFVLFFYRLDERALWSSHEGRAAQHAQLMIDTGRWGMPTLYFGVADYQKPPLYYWLVACVAKLRGGVVDAWAVRLPASMAALVGVCLVYLAGASFGRPSLGIAAALILSSSLRYSWLARVGRIDMPLALAVATVLICFYAAYRRVASAQSRRGAWPWMFAAYLAVSVAMLLKGPVGLVLPLIPIVLFLVWERQPLWPWRPGFGTLMHQFGVWWGIVVVLACAGPWFVWASLATDGAFFKTFFLHHHWDRTLGVAGLKAGPVWYYVPQILVDIFPWSVLIPAAVWRQLGRAHSGSDSLGRFALCWSAGMFAFLSLVRFKRHDYVLPLLPGLALLLSQHWQELHQAGQTRRDKRWTAVISAVVIAVACAYGGGVVIALDSSLANGLLHGPGLRSVFNETDRLLAQQLGESAKRVSSALLPAAFCIFILAACGVWLMNKRQPTAAAAAVAALWLVAFLSYVRYLLPTLEPLREQRTIARLAREYDAMCNRALAQAAFQAVSMSAPARSPQLIHAPAPLYYYGQEDQQLMFYLGPNARWLINRKELWPVITQLDPVFVVMELERFTIRQTDWPDVTMVPLAQNTDNSLGVHCKPVVLVTNAAGWQMVQARHGESGRYAN
jgi:4-amino-4-deoxy-L-arabinose transferase-like glycosyltransferase